VNEIIFRSDAERLAGLEARMHTLEGYYGEINGKLDSLMELKNKGAGIFWLASALFGTLIVLAGTNIMNWFKHL
jgi:hypothetical protein